MELGSRAAAAVLHDPHCTMRRHSILVMCTVTPASAWQLAPARAWQLVPAPARRSAAVVAGLDGLPASVADAGDAQKKKRISRDPDAVDLSDGGATFESLCKLSGVPADRNSVMDIDGFVLAFEQLFNDGMPLEPEQADELLAAVGSKNDEDVSMGDWTKFHHGWVAATKMDAHLQAIVDRKEMLREAEKREKQRVEEAQKFAEALAAAKAQKKDTDRPTLMSDAARRSVPVGPNGQTIEWTEGAAERAAQHRSLEPEAWGKVAAGVGGLDECLDEIRRRIWVSAAGRWAGWACVVAACVVVAARGMARPHAAPPSGRAGAALRAQPAARGAGRPARQGPAPLRPARLRQVAPRLAPRRRPLATAADARTPRLAGPVREGRHAAAARSARLTRRRVNSCCALVLPLR